MPSAPVIPAPCHCEFVTLGSGSAAHRAQCPEHVTHSACTETSQHNPSMPVLQMKQMLNVQLIIGGLMMQKACPEASLLSSCDGFQAVCTVLDLCNARLQADFLPTKQ